MGWWEATHFLSSSPLFLPLSRTHLFRQEVDGRGAVQGHRLDAGDDVDEVDLVAVAGREGRERGEWREGRREVEVAGSGLNARALASPFSTRKPAPSPVHVGQRPHQGVLALG
jgi:hypothetical protein